MSEVISRHNDTDYGGSSSAIQYHYDVSREFYRLWLDETMTYSCALWDETDNNDSLYEAQLRKIEFHMAAARVEQAQSVLDVGCGWGALVRTLSEQSQVKQIVGLTLSEDQAAYVDSMNLKNVKVYLESWTQHQPSTLYDSIISVGAFEHFAKPEESVEEKIVVYRDFFKNCHSWLSPNGRMSLQTIAYGSMKREEASEFINNEIFPASDLPRLSEITEAADGIFEITAVYNHRLHYARTFETWAKNLRARRVEAVALVGEDVTRRYERYLKQSSIGFYMGKIGLLRIILRSISTRTAEMAVP